MQIRQKFFVLAGLIGFIMAVVSGIGYYTAYTNLTESIEKEIQATVAVQGESLDGWLREKAQPAVTAGNLLTALDGKPEIANLREIMSLGTGDKEVLDLTHGNEDGLFMTWVSGDNTGKVDPRKRPWYIDAKKSGHLIFTEAYKDATKGVLVVSAAMPYKDKNGNFRGAICDDISLDVLQQRVDQVKYRGEGRGLIIEKGGKILASSQKGEGLTEVSANEGLRDHFQEMVQKGSGYFLTKKDGENRVFAYTTVPSTGWIVGISVAETFVFGQVAKLKLFYAGLTLIGILLVLFVSMQFSNRITAPIIRLKEHADQLAQGNLRQKNLDVISSDEIGTLTTAFNTMSNNIRDLIRKMASTAEQVAASSEELTASSQQSAEASNHVATTVSQVADGMQDQMHNIDKAKTDVDLVCNDISDVADKTTKIATTSSLTATEAQKGETLMIDAMSKMGHIEASVMNSAKVVRQLGDNSQQIGQIVDAIAAIADQTNLLALNAAIEAARAGEHGRGFAVVAEEVRKLAAESQSSAEEIKNRIASIRIDTEKAVESMQSGTTEVQKGTSAIREVGTQFTNIMQMVNDINTQMDEVNTSVQAVSNGANRIVQAVASIDDVSRTTAGNTQTISAATEEQSASTEEIASASQALAQMATELQKAAGAFKI